MLIVVLSQTFTIQPNLLDQFHSITRYRSTILSIYNYFLISYYLLLFTSTYFFIIF